MTFPWEIKLPAKPVEDVVKLIQKDMRFMVTHTGILVHAHGPHAASLQMLVNTPRGQLVPKGSVRYTQGNVIEFQDVGMCQPGAPTMTIQELLVHLHDVVTSLNLELDL